MPAWPPLGAGQTPFQHPWVSGGGDIKAQRRRGSVGDNALTRDGAGPSPGPCALCTRALPCPMSPTLHLGQLTDAYARRPGSQFQLLN